MLLGASAGIAGIAIASVAHGQNILMVTDSGEESEGTVVSYGNFLGNAGYNVSISGNYDTGGADLSSTQINEINSYDLIIFPRLGVTPQQGNPEDSFFGSNRDWNSISTPLLLHQPFLALSDHDTADSHKGWGWQHHQGSGDNSEAQRLAVIDPNHSIFDGVAFEDDEGTDFITMYNEVTPHRRPNSNVDIMTGTHIADEMDHSFNRVWIHHWDGTESVFYDEADGGRVPGVVGGPRTFFLFPNTGDINDFTDDGQQVLLNSVAYTIPEPRTYALLFGGVVGLLVFVRRLRKS